MITIDPPSPLFPSTQTSALTRFLNRTRTAVGLPGNIDVLLTTDNTLRRLNRTFRGINKPTDVLSFPAAAPNGHTEDNPVAGDLAISLETAARQAAEHGHTLALEVRILILHGTLHLAGYDHENDSGEMAEREGELRRELRLPTTLIARAHAPRPQPAVNPGAPSSPKASKSGSAGYPLRMQTTASPKPRKSQARKALR